MTLAIMFVLAILFVVIAILLVGLLAGPHHWVHTTATGCPWQASTILPNRCGLCGNPYYEHVIRGRS